MRLPVVAVAFVAAAVVAVVHTGTHYCMDRNIDLTVDSSNLAQTNCFDSH